MPFKQAAELSWRIASQEGFGAHAEPGRAEGLLLDVAELWELFLLACTREAAHGLRVEHDTSSSERTFLLTSQADEQRGLGRLKPDIVVYDDDRVVAVIDAKYKRLQDAWPERPAGVDRADLYQLTSYLVRLDPHGGTAGMLLYPRDTEQTVAAAGERHGPWHTRSRGSVWFERLAVTAEGAVARLGELLGGPIPGCAIIRAKSNA